MSPLFAILSLGQLQSLDNRVRCSHWTFGSSAIAWRPQRAWRSSAVGAVLLPGAVLVRLGHVSRSVALLQLARSRSGLWVKVESVKAEDEGALCAS